MNDLKNIYRNPLSGVSLMLTEYDNKLFLASGKGSATEGEPFPVIAGIPRFVTRQQTEGLNEKYQRFYDKIAPAYKLSAMLMRPFSRKNYQQLLGNFPLQNGDRVLEVSVGTGDNFKYLYPLAPKAEYWGMDLSAGMLHQCQKNLRRWGIPAHLAQANAEALPYASASFDAVFHIGGINFFNDKAAALAEMVRVAKPGTRIFVIDETEKWVRKVYQKMPVVQGYYQQMDDASLTAAPTAFLPQGVTDVHTELIWKGSMYKLSFTVE